MKPTYHQVQQGDAAWHSLRCGTITASMIGKLLTGAGKPADNATSRGLITELAAQRITQYVEPVYISDDMLRGHEDEIKARALYSREYAPVTEVGFATVEISPGIVIGASPDGIVGDDGLIEVKSRRQRLQLETIMEDEVPDQYLPQIQMQMLVTGRHWCDFISYCGGMVMFVKRVYPDPAMQDAILDACLAAEERIGDAIRSYNLAAMTMHPTERPPDVQEMI